MKPISNIDRRSIVKSIASALGLFGFGASNIAFSQSSSPIRIGGTLALTGPLSATGLVHKIVSDIAIEDLNKRGGLLGRKVEYILKDDQSKPDITRTLYEQLITNDKVDLIIGPYATQGILSAATNQFKDFKGVHSDMFLFNKVINEAWFNNEFDVMINYPKDLSMEIIEAILKKENNGELDSDEWKKWVLHCKNQYRNFGCIVD